MIGTWLPLVFIGELFGDINLILKIFVLMTIVMWVKNHVGNTPLAWLLIGGIAYFILFDGWLIFGPIYVLYMLLGFGIAGVIIDFFFVGGASGSGTGGEEQSPVSSGVDIAKRMQQGAHLAVRRRAG